MRTLLILLASLLASLGMSQSEPNYINMDIRNYQELRDACGEIITSINGIDFDYLPAQNVSLQRVIDDAEDGGIVHLPLGHYDLNVPIKIAKNLTLIGDAIVVLDAKRRSNILEIGVNESNISVEISNVIFVNGKGLSGASISSGARSLSVDKCGFFNNIAVIGASISQTGGELRIKNSSFRRNAADTGIIDCQYCRLFMENDVLADNVALSSRCVLNFTGVGMLNPENRCEIIDIYSKYKRGDDIDCLDLAMRNCTIEHNRGLRGRFGLSMVSAAGNSLIDNCDFRSNDAAQYAGALSVGGDAVIIANCTIEYNTAIKPGLTPGLWIMGSSNVLIDRCLIADNHYLHLSPGSCSGGIFIASDSNVTMHDCTISNNWAANGGGIYIQPGAILIVDGGEILGNIARSSNRHRDGVGLGGGIYNDGTLILRDYAIIARNMADAGAGIYNTEGGRVRAEGNSYFIGNEAKDKGGAIFNNGSVALECATFADNEAFFGGSIYNLGDLTEADSRFCKNIGLRQNTSFSR
ncbi:MAG TPA: right-handed parallel beta-helix repeat-containing protein [Methanotrichaceae archaeon]|nr:right-handed parallel beta-helix repeat-containing protein [Methanotrichaceae archaeon]HQF16650.1 right-handed parallel beta-helix repeat-containing protein [Methanotrichaceae archaeon]HQI91338.1 right-handed parallel beta-helix repeat-containing protein [Methanotrichaceae archaeon]HQJ29436.1 right-handed parallel beta-helix repeat-containing protein [Methanotrichaceae archaeon]